MSTSGLSEILQQLIENGFKTCIFSLKDGLPLASRGSNEKSLGAMSAMLMEAVEKVRDGLELSNTKGAKLVFEDSYILCRNITIGKKSYLLSGITEKPISDEIGKYYEELLDWAVEHGGPLLEKLSSL
ncbi:MAG: hypothetical protein ACTSWY_15500 [Promethearchaeota archaeon]